MSSIKSEITIMQYKNNVIWSFYNLLQYFFLSVENSITQWEKYYNWMDWFIRKRRDREGKKG